MTTVWRPHVRREIPNSDDAKVEVEVPEEVNKGVKRKRAPHTKGPCEHGVKYRSKCKVCSACPHGRQRANARSAVGHQSASTVVARSVQGVRWVRNLRARSSAPSMQGVRWCINLRARSCSALDARSAVVHQSASTVVERSQCKECGGAAICEHGRRRSTARSAVGHQICEHGRRRTVCKECRGA